jgi:hypothetical protein
MIFIIEASKSHQFGAKLQVMPTLALVVIWRDNSFGDPSPWLGRLHKSDRMLETGGMAFNLVIHIRIAKNRRAQVSIGQFQPDVNLSIPQNN